MKQRKTVRQVDRGGINPAQNCHLVVPGLSGPLRQVTNQEDRESAIYEEPIPTVLRIEAGCIGVEILSQAAHRRDTGFNHCQEALIGMKVIGLVPVDSGKSQIAPPASRMMTRTRFDPPGFK